MEANLRWQAQAPSDLYRILLTALADDVAAGGVAWTVLAPFAHLPDEAAVPLRLMGAAHRLALRGAAPNYAAHLPTCGGDGDAHAAARALLNLCTRDDLAVEVAQPVQTNEPARAAHLLVAFSHVHATTGLPLRLLEVGASAGLLLRFDRYHYRIGEQRWGDPEAAVRLESNGQAPLGPAPVADRRGCDVNPLDPAVDRDLLLSFIWGDHVDRFTRLQAALDVAQDHPVPIDRSSASEWLNEQLARVCRGTTTVIYHAIVWQYLTEEERAHVRETIDGAARRATKEAPLAWVRLEPHPEPWRGAELRVTTWPGGRDDVLALCSYHGERFLWRPTGDVRATLDSSAKK